MAGRTRDEVKAESGLVCSMVIEVDMNNGGAVDALLEGRLDDSEVLSKDAPRGLGLGVETTSDNDENSNNSVEVPEGSSDATYTSRATFAKCLRLPNGPTA